MKYIKKYEQIEKRQGLYADDSDIKHFIKYLNDKDVRFTLLYGKDDEDEDEKYFLILINDNEYGKLPYDHDVGDFLDYYIEDEEDNMFYLNWFDLDEVNKGEWQLINIDDVNLYITSRKYNL